MVGTSRPRRAGQGGSECAPRGAPNDHDPPVGVASARSCGSAPCGSAPCGRWIEIEIELLGEDDRPVVGERYRLELDDGSTGCVRLEGIDPGRCKVTFPDLDPEAWEPA